MTTKAKKSTVLTLHQLLPAFSYWGTTSRIILIAFIALIVCIIRASELESSGMALGVAILAATQGLFYAIGSFLILEVGYLTIARALPFRLRTDQAILLGVEVVMALTYFLPYFALVPSWIVSTSRYLLLAVLFVLGLRLLMGYLYGQPEHGSER